MDVVVTCLLTNTKDPQRGRRMSTRSHMWVELQHSVARHHVPLVMLHDCLTNTASLTTTYVRVAPGGNPYFHRWQVIADWLDTANVDRVWCVDATDVVMLHDPFPHMQPGVLYSGSEPRRLGNGDEHNAWLRGNHPAYAEFCDAHPELLYMNPGILGGSATDVAWAARQLADAQVPGELTDMGAWQQIAHMFDRLQTGHPVHTEYRAYDHTDPTAWWAHK